MDKLKCALLEVKNTFNNIPMVSKIFMLIYLIIVFSIYFKSILKGVLGVIIFLLSTFMYMLIFLTKLNAKYFAEMLRVYRNIAYLCKRKRETLQR